MDKALPGWNTLIPRVILGYVAFPLKSYLKKPYKKKTQLTKEKIFNYRQSRGRLVVENAFGILTSRFRILLNRINLSPEKVELVVIACCFLHNLLTSRTQEPSKYINCILEQFSIQPQIDLLNCQ